MGKEKPMIIPTQRTEEQKRQYKNWDNRVRIYNKIAETENTNAIIAESLSKSGSISEKDYLDMQNKIKERLRVAKADLGDYDPAGIYNKIVKTENANVNDARALRASGLMSEEECSRIENEAAEKIESAKVRLKEQEDAQARDDEFNKELDEKFNKENEEMLAARREEFKNNKENELHINEIKQILDNFNKIRERMTKPWNLNEKKTLRISGGEHGSEDGMFAFESAIGSGKKWEAIFAKYHNNQQYQGFGIKGWSDDLGYEVSMPWDWFNIGDFVNLDEIAIAEVAALEEKCLERLRIMNKNIEKAMGVLPEKEPGKLRKLGLSIGRSTGVWPKDLTIEK
ncbi:MAG: hypothetical protein LBM01_00735 [Christensenellaceae bacterium]|jgi:hypothetical protein|nr:hypothetical protein [Christensenellaceae bacterium]